MKSTRSFYIDTEHWRVLKEVAEEKETSVSEILSILISQYLQSLNRLPKREEEASHAG